MEPSSRPMGRSISPSGPGCAVPEKQKYRVSTYVSLRHIHDDCVALMKNRHQDANLGPSNQVSKWHQQPGPCLLSH
jgi:hypothetical protein